MDIASLTAHLLRRRFGVRERAPSLKGAACLRTPNEACHSLQLSVCRGCGLRDQVCPCMAFPGFEQQQMDPFFKQGYEMRPTQLSCHRNDNLSVWEYLGKLHHPVEVACFEILADMEKKAGRVGLSFGVEAIDRNKPRVDLNMLNRHVTTTCRWYRHVRKTCRIVGGISTGHGLPFLSNSRSAVLMNRRSRPTVSLVRMPASSRAWR